MSSDTFGPQPQTPALLADSPTPQPEQELSTEQVLGNLANYLEALEQHYAVANELQHAKSHNYPQEEQARLQALWATTGDEVERTWGVMAAPDAAVVRGLAEAHAATRQVLRKAEVDKACAYGKGHDDGMWLVGELLEELIKTGKQHRCAGTPLAAIDAATAIHELRRESESTQTENDRLRAALAEAEAREGRLLQARDEAREAADRLAYACFSVEEIGEHTNLNCPWANAAERLEALATALREKGVECYGGV